MKRVVCFGDSNTWGANPLRPTRLEKKERWPGRLQLLLGDEWEVVEEGQCGRTIGLDDIWEGGTKNGIKYLAPMLESHSPLDALIIMLGTNDLKQRFGLGARDIAGSLATMIELAKSKTYFTGQDMRILVVSPIHLGGGIAQSSFGDLFSSQSVAESKKLGTSYKQVANRYGCEFLDAALYAKAAKEDELHMVAGEHKKLAEAIAHEFKKNC